MPAGHVGVDEAGKGPVLGSMFAAAVRITDASLLPTDVDDSKNLAPARRQDLAATLRETDGIALATAEITPKRIDRPSTDMNTLTVDGHAEAATQLLEDGDELVLDAGDTSEARFARRVGDRLDADCSVLAEHGADEHHPIVGAASIVAKVARDAHVRSLAETHADLVDAHGPLGSGYPSDPNTRAFLESHVDEHGTVPPFARGSWSTCQELLADHEQAGISDF